MSVPLHDRIQTGTLQQIAEQCGAKDFREWCEWIDEHRCVAYRGFLDSALPAISLSRFYVPPAFVAALRGEVR